MLHPLPESRRPPREAASGVTTTVGDVGAKDTPDHLHEQATLDQYVREQSDRAATSGMAAAEAADIEWCERAYAWIESLEPGTELDADSLRYAHGRSRAAGPLFRKASRAGLIEPIGISTSRSVTRHGGISRRWRRT